MDADAFAVDLRADGDFRSGVFDRVAQQVGDRVRHALEVEFDAQTGGQGAAVDREFEAATENALRLDLLLEPGAEFDRGQVQLGLFALETRVGQAGIDQIVEFVEVDFHHFPQAFALFALVGFGEHFEREAHARDRCAQFVRDGAGHFLLRRDQALNAFGHAVERFGEQVKSAAARRRRALFEVAVAERARRLAQRFEVAPHRPHPEPDGDRQAETDQAPGQQADAQFERQCARSIRIGVGREWADHQNLRRLLQAVVEDVAFGVDRQFAGIELVGLFGR